VLIQPQQAAAVVLGPRGLPEPPTDIVRRLQQIHPRLSLIYQEQYSGGYHWAVILGWPEGDERYKYIQSGELPPGSDYDILCWLPADCSVDEAYGYVVRSFRAGSREEARQLVDRAHKWNEDVKERAWQEVLDEPLNRAEVRAGKMFAETRGEIPTSAPSVTPAKRGKTAKELRAQRKR
jgi:hypothetical protein